jgi:hypothetical protein
MGSIPFTSRKNMEDNLLNTGDIDPEIADLLGDDTSPASVPDFSDLFDDQPSSRQQDPKDVPAEDFSRENFPSIAKWEQDPDPVFFEKDYYSKVLVGEGDISKRIHTILQKFLKAEDPQERGVYRQRLIPAWWDLARNLATHYQGTVIEKRWALRFGYFLPTLVSQEQRRMLSKIISGDEYKEPIHYVDEWFDLVLEGHINPLATDELNPSKMSRHNKTKAQLEKAKGSKEANLTQLRTLIHNRDGLEADLSSQLRLLTQHDSHPTIPGIKIAYTSEQKISMNRAAEILRKLGKLDKDINFNIEKFKDADVELGKLGNKLEQLGGLSKADKGAMENELESIRQMSKMCVGRQGNHLPFLMKNFFYPNMDLVGSRENVIRYMDQVEQVDPGVFRRSFRQKTNRIVPHTIIIPCYGEKGVCWEPFERFNRSTSRGRIAIPMFPKNLKLAVIFALGDLRWNVAKEKAAHYWMEEGLTGHYYQWFSSRKQRGDVRLRFLDDYVLWITKEVEGMQKLEKEVRAIFWRYMPFTQPVKDGLRNRGFVYDELYKKDMNREMSDGY